MKKLSVITLALVLLASCLAFGQTQTPASQTANAIQTLIAQDEGVVATANSQALTNFNNSCTAWTATNIQNRAIGQKLTAKPVQPVALHFSATVAPDGQSASTSFTVGPDSLGAACPDLPSATLPANTVQVGALLVSTQFGSYYAVGKQDTQPAGVPVQSGGHTYIKQQSPGAAVVNADGTVPGWYLLLQ